MTDERKMRLVAQVLTDKLTENGVQVVGGNIAAFIQFCAQAALLPTEQVDAQLLAYAEAKKAKIDTDINTLDTTLQQETTRLNTEKGEYQEVIDALDS